MNELVDQVGQLLSAGDFDGAHALVLAAASPAQELGRAQLALARHDAGAAVTFARKALELGAGAPAHHLLAVARLMVDDPNGAVDEARKAVGLDSSPKSRASLGGILLGAGRFADAATVLRQVASETPDDSDVQLNLGTAAAKTGDYAGAISAFARALEQRPQDSRPLQNLLGMFAEIGKWMGALAALEMSRQGTPPPDVAITLDLVHLHLVRLVAGGKFPPRGLAKDADDAVTNVLAHASGRPVAQQLLAARTLVDFDRLDEARQLVGKLAGAGQTGSERAGVLYLEGYFAESQRDTRRALERYLQAMEADPSRAEAAVNASSLLLEDPSNEALDALGELLGRVPANVMNTSASLLYNAAVHHARSGHRTQARANLERILKLERSDSPIAARARQALADLARTAS